MFFPLRDKGKPTDIRRWSSELGNQKPIDFVDSDSDHFEQPAIDTPSRGERSLPLAKKTGMTISNKHSTTQQKQERVLTVMPIDRQSCTDSGRQAGSLDLSGDKPAVIVRNCKKDNTGHNFYSVLHIENK